MAGRRAKPNALKALDGNPGKRPYEDEFLPPADPEEVPEHLAADPVAVETYRDVGRELLKAGLFTVLDIDLVAAFAKYRSRWIRAGLQVDKEGDLITGAKGNLYRNPRLDVEAQAFANMERIMGQLGLSPAARARLKTRGAAIDASGKGLLDQIVSGGEPVDEADVKDWRPPKNGTVG